MQEADDSGVLTRQAKALRKLESGETDLVRIRRDILIEPRYQALQCMEEYKSVSPEELRWKLRQAPQREVTCD